MPLPMLLLATFSAGLYARSRALAISGLPIALIAIVAGAILDTAASPLAVGIAILSALVCGAWTAGFLIRRPAQQITRERAQAPARARDAVAAERARFGARALRCRRSLGDGHLGSGRGREGTARSSARKGPHPHIEAVRRSAHDALVELRRLVGVLREDEPAYSPQPGLRHLGELLAETARPACRSSFPRQATSRRFRPGWSSPRTASHRRASQTFAATPASRPRACASSTARTVSSSTSRTPPVSATGSLVPAAPRIDRHARACAPLRWNA